MFRQIVSFLQSSRRDLLILFTALFNKNTPKTIKTMTIVAFLYLISPIDLLPDVLPGVGLIDDAVVVPGILFAMTQMLPAAVRVKSEAQAEFLSPKIPWILGICGIAFIAWIVFILMAIYRFIFS